MKKKLLEDEINNRADHKVDEVMEVTKSPSEEMLENLEEDKDPLPWLPEIGTKFILKFDQGEREYKVTYINQGKFRFSSEPTDKDYMK